MTLDFTPHDRDAQACLLEASRDGMEHLLVYDAETGDRLCLHTDRAKRKVAFPAAIRPLLSDPRRRLVAHHNHPGGEPPSSGDVIALWRFPGLLALWVHTIDG